MTSSDSGPASEPIRFEPSPPASRLRLLPEAFGRSISRATSIGLVVAFIATPIISMLMPLDERLGPLVWLVWPFLLAAIGTIVWPIAMPPGVRAAYGTFSWLGRWERDRFRSLTGSSVPSNEAAVRRWLTEHPQPGFGGYARMEMLAYIGDYDRARVELAEFGEPADPADATERISLAAWLDQMETGTFDSGPLRAAIEGLPDGPARWRAEIALALLETRRRLGEGAKRWWEPLAAIRPRLGREPTWIVVRDTLARLFVLEFVVALVFSGVMQVVTGFLF